MLDQYGRADTTGTGYSIPTRNGDLDNFIAGSSKTLPEWVGTLIVIAVASPWVLIFGIFIHSLYQAISALP